MFDEEQQFITLKAKILKDRGLDCTQYKTNYLKRRIAVRMRAHGVESYREYKKILVVDDKEDSRILVGKVLRLRGYEVIRSSESLTHR